VLRLTTSGLAINIITYGELYEGAAFARDSEPALVGLRAFLKGKAILLLIQATMDRFAHIPGQPSPSDQAANPQPQALPAKLIQSAFPFSSPFPPLSLLLSLSTKVRTHEVSSFARLKCTPSFLTRPCKIHFPVLTNFQ
jgi:hypothetical protein